MAERWLNASQMNVFEKAFIINEQVGFVSVISVRSAWTSISCEEFLAYDNFCSECDTNFGCSK